MSDFENWLEKHIVESGARDLRERNLMRFSAYRSREETLKEAIQKLESLGSVGGVAIVAVKELLTPKDPR